MVVISSHFVPGNHNFKVYLIFTADEYFMHIPSKQMPGKIDFSKLYI
jgi:hypothetical protein